MIFDMFARAVERGATELRDLLQKARLFWFPYRAQDVLPKEFDGEFIELNRESFHLPFRHIAIEDKASLVFLSDRNNNQSGLKADRDFVEVLPVHAALNNFREDVPNIQKKIIQEDMKRAWPPGAMIVSWGTLNDVHLSRTNKLALLAKVAGMAWCTPDGVWDSLDRELGLMEKDGKGALEATILNVGVAIQEIMFFNQPCRFIMECVPDAVAKRKKKKNWKKAKIRIPREHERPKYTLLKPGEIRKVLGLSEPLGAGPKVRIHERRRHYRTLRSEKFVHKRWQTIIVAACWAGKSEVKVGKRRYKVLLDR